MPTLYSEIEDLEADLEQRKNAYLRRFGWQVTCNTPGAFWLWRRDFADIDARRAEWDRAHNAGQPGKPSKSTPYGIVTAGTDLAVSMTLKCLDERAELQDEDAA